MKTIKLGFKFGIGCIVAITLVTLFTVNRFKEGKEFNETDPETHRIPKLSMKRANLISKRRIANNGDSNKNSVISSNLDTHQKILDTNKRIRILYISDPEHGKTAEIICKPNQLLETDSTTKGISDDGKPFEILTKLIESKDLY
mgnify:FL=1